MTFRLLAELLNEDADTAKLEAWKKAVKVKHQDVADKLKFKSRIEGSKNLVCAEVSGMDRCFGVFDMDKMSGEVLGEGLLTEDWITRIEGMLKKMGVKAVLRGMDLQIDSKINADRLKSMCKDAGIMCPHISIKSA